MYTPRETLDDRNLADRSALVCCATAGDLEHSGPDTVTWSGRYDGIKRNGRGKKEEVEKREPLSKTLPWLHGLMTFLRPLVAGQKGRLRFFTVAFLRTVLSSPLLAAR